ncbi:MAG: hypothetical protein ABIL76_06970 [candidate division WOR-3 bacterium]
MKYIIITCDTEVGELAKESNITDAFEIFIEGKVDGDVVGVDLINKISSDFGVKIDHFVDIYPFERYGERKFANLCEKIIKDGHNIHLHTHPLGKFSDNKKYMWEYSFEEQVEIIKFGQEKIKQWVGIDVLVHRSGGYGADNNTLRALKVNGILIDSSFFYNNSQCKLNYKYKNVPSLYNDIFEIPITVYKIIKKSIFKKEKIIFRKLNFRYESNVSEILKVIDSSPDQCVFVIFLHSFNFLNLVYNFEINKFVKINKNNRLILEYKNFLERISLRKECCFTNILEICKKDIHFEDYIVTIEEKYKISSLVKFIKNKFISRNQEYV